MSDNVFLDTNVLVYAHVTGDVAKHDIALDLLRTQLQDENIFVSTQVIGEFYAAMTKYKCNHNEITHYLDEIIEGANVTGVMLSTVEYCLKLKERYEYSYWDSLILAAALDCECKVIYSEDMQHNQVIEGSLTILNPFISLTESIM